jgi:type IV fimbrial biogenesis protein FimT
LAEKMRLMRATEPVYERLVYAHSEAIKRFRPFVVGFSADGSETWAFGMTDTAGSASCNPALTDAAASGACVIDDDNNAATSAVLVRTASTDLPKVSMQGQPEDGNNIVCTDVGANVRFDVPTGISRGIDGNPIDANCAVVLRTTHFETRVRVGPTGHVWICSPAGGSKVAWYPNC